MPAASRSWNIPVCLGALLDFSIKSDLETLLDLI